ncbi:MAG: lipid A deacylase LpxR family protein [Betaproteobacteria bacterium]|nr:lipid A deacylase LpxR family protein [Betaproteobacteria bacterium]
MSRLHRLVAWACLMLASPLILADNGETSLCEESPPGIAALAHHPELYNFYFENDLFSGTDSGYTNGVKFSWVSANLKDYTSDPCLPHWVRQLNQIFETVHPGKYTSRNMVITGGQMMFTPRDRSRSDLIRDDRPYAGWLYLGLGYNARNAQQMDTVEVNLGVVGPAALARQSQEFVHDLRGIARFNGWNNQINNELGFQLVAERKNRIWSEGGANLQFDAITHYGASLGNIRTYLNTGMELRAGSRIPNDFGTSPIRPAGDSNAPLEGSVTRRFSDGGLHAFLSADARAVARDIFLDGNTFSDSHSVDKKRFVGDLATGIAWQWSGGKITYARYVRSKEFTAQENTHSFGSVTLSLEY